MLKIGRAHQVVGHVCRQSDDKYSHILLASRVRVDFWVTVALDVFLGRQVSFTSVSLVAFVWLSAAAMSLDALCS